MSDEIDVQTPDALSAQARLHAQIRDFFHTALSSFDAHHEAIASQLNGEFVGPYQQWWQTIRSHLLQHAQVHDQFASHLEGARRAYEDTEKQNTSSFDDSRLP